jgi:hypothetical protein
VVLNNITLTTTSPYGSLASSIVIISFIHHRNIIGAPQHPPPTTISSSPPPPNNDYFALRLALVVVGDGCWVGWMLLAVVMRLFNTLLHRSPTEGRGAVQQVASDD